MNSQNPADLAAANVVSTQAYPSATTPPGDSLTTQPIASGALAEKSPSRIGRYRVLRRLGEGGFGQVWLAHDDELDRAVAIKIAHAHRVAGEEDAQAYLAEARVVASLDHPGIVPVYDAGRLPDGRCYVVSKYMEGGDLEQHAAGGPLPCLEAAKIVAAVAEALHFAHDRGILHRDIKPANILLDKDGTPRLADFGLALRVQITSDPGSSAGTPAYMSPEQMRGERLDRRSDVYSLGLVLYRLLFGRVPGGEARNSFPRQAFHEVTRDHWRNFKTNSYDLIIDEKTNLPTGIGADVLHCCIKSISFDPNERYAAASKVSAQLRRWTREGSSEFERPEPTDLAIVHTVDRLQVKIAEAERAFQLVKHSAAVSPFAQRDHYDRMRELRDSVNHIHGFTLANRTGFSQVIVRARIEILRNETLGRGMGGPSPTRALNPIASWKIDLPRREIVGETVHVPDRPVIIAPADAALIDVEFEPCISRICVLRVIFISDRGDEAASEFFTV